ncbi:MAG: methionine--tRNA ligase subunit beta, partial [Aristaeellaceae bacterium]
RVAVMVGFVMPRTPERIFQQLGVTDEALKCWDSLNKAFPVLTPGLTVKKGEALFPRLDVQKEIERDQPAEEKPAKKAEKQAKKDDKKADKAQKKEEKKHEEPTYPEAIDIDTFFQSKIQVGRVLECSAVPKSKKLLQFRLSFGKDGERTILSGIAQYYPDPAALVGRQIVAITNLKPRMMMGIESHGMILSAVDDAGNLRLASVGEGVADGALIG